MPADGRVRPLVSLLASCALMGRAGYEDQAPRLRGEGRRPRAVV